MSIKATASCECRSISKHAAWRKMGPKARQCRHADVFCSFFLRGQGFHVVCFGRKRQLVDFGGRSTQGELLFSESMSFRLRGRGGEALRWCKAPGWIILPRACQTHSIEENAIGPTNVHYGMFHWALWMGKRNLLRTSWVVYPNTCRGLSILTGAKWILWSHIIPGRWFFIS